MPADTPNHTVFTKSLFRAGSECMTKLYYRSRDEYPENGSHLPYTAHNAFNKKMLGLLLKTSLPPGVEIEGTGYSERSSMTEKRLIQSSAVLYNASFLVDNLHSAVPVLVKNRKEVDLYFVQTKAVHSSNPTLYDRQGQIRNKWIDYLTEIAYQTLVVEKKHPDWIIKPWLVLPNRRAHSATDNLDLKLAGIGGDGMSKTMLQRVRKPGSDLLVKIPVRSEIAEIQQRHYLHNKGTSRDFEGYVMEMARIYRDRKKVSTAIGKKCKNCEFRVDPETIGDRERSGFRECWRNHLDIEEREFDAPHVFDLFGSGTGKMIENGIYFQKNLASEKDTVDRIYYSNGRITDRDRQLLQILKAKGEERLEIIMKPQLRDELPRWRFPLHFIDFEAGSYAVPLKKGHRPYDPVAFQFSCHTLKEKGELQHHEWISVDNHRYSNYELIRQLKAVPAIAEGTIIHYSNFERHMLKNISAELRKEKKDTADQLAEWIDRVIGRNDSSSTVAPYLVDMNRLVKNYYYNPFMDNSLSLKDLLHAVMKVSPYIKKRYSGTYDGSNFQAVCWWRESPENGVMNPYCLMEEEQSTAIRRGTQAMAAYARLRVGEAEKEQHEEIKKSLLQYCEMDTLAMVMVYQHWRELLETS